MSDKNGNESFCILPWLHMYVDPKGDVFPCCVHEPTSAPFGNINRQSPEEIWNGSDFRQLRVDFTSGKKRPEICAACYQSENTGTASHRTEFNRSFSHHIQPLVGQTDQTGYVPEMKLLYWDFRFSNICNLKCRSCGPDYSSSWKADAAKLGYSENNVHDGPSFDRYRFAMDQIPHVEAIYFAGGEPLLMKEHFEILNELIRTHRTDVRLAYNSNFNRLHYGKHSIVDLWKHFKNLTLSPSVDQIGDKAEYVRKGVRWADFVENVATVRRELPWANVWPTITVSVFNILELPEIHEQLCSLDIISKKQPDGVTFNILRSPKMYNIGMLPAPYKAEAKRKLLDYKEKFLIKTGVKLHSIDSILVTLEQDLTDHVDQFLTMTRQLDEIRKEDFFALFPEYKGLAQNA